jgi:hydroxypyruvate isomerase
MTRRRFLSAAGSAVVAAGGLGALGGALVPGDDMSNQSRTGRIRQSVCQWCYGKMPVADLCSLAKRLGLVGIDLVGPEHFATLKQHGLIGTMTPSHNLAQGLCNPQYHAECLAKIRTAIDATAEAGFPNVICFSGNRGGIDDEQGLANCAHALKQIVGLAEQRGVMLCMELLNSKRDHKDYMCDSTEWGARLVSAVGSPRLKLLYDIYHMQIDEGDVINTIRTHKDAIAHYHTAGVPGRHELDQNQELNYPAIARAIAETGFNGFLAHEFLPTRDAAAGLQQAIEQCTV